MEWYFKVLMNYAGFNGRARRKEYWTFFLINTIAQVASRYLDQLFSARGKLVLGYTLITIIPALAVGVRRLHDTDRSGWWLLIPGANLIFLLLDSQSEENRFGPNPKSASVSTSTSQLNNASEQHERAKVFVDQKRLRASDEDRIYEQIANELDSNSPHKASWTKALELSGGDEGKTKSNYIKIRRERLLEERAISASAEITEDANVNLLPVINQQRLNSELQNNTSIDTEVESRLDNKTSRISLSDIIMYSVIFCAITLMFILYLVGQEKGKNAVPSLTVSAPAAAAPAKQIADLPVENKQVTQTSVPQANEYSNTAKHRGKKGGLTKEDLKALDAIAHRDAASASVNWPWLDEMSSRLERQMPDSVFRREFLETVHYEAVRANLDPQLVLSLIDVASGFNKYAISPNGEKGFMKVDPDWVRKIGSPDQNLFHLRVNLRYGCTILKFYLNEENGDWLKALDRYDSSHTIPRFTARVMEKLIDKWAYQNPDHVS